MLSRVRALPLPRAVNTSQLLRFSTRARQCEQSSNQAQQYRPPVDPNLIASMTADPAYPPSSMKSQLRPKDPHASRRASLPPKDRPYPTRGDSHKAKVAEPLIPGAVKSLEPALCAPNLPYFVNRTRGNELPVYNERKGQGRTQLRTIVSKIDGNVEKLRNELRGRLALPDSDVVINPVNKHIHIKGHHKKIVQHHLWERRF